MAKKSQRRIFGGNKYAAFHLLICRWLRHFAVGEDYCYITLGGTELRDIHSMSFVDARITNGCTSYELQPERFQLAANAATLLNANGIDVKMAQASVFDFERRSDNRHLFFIDLEGVFAWADYHVRIGEMLDRGAIRDGDVILVTSYLGRNPGWPKIFSEYAAEYSILGISDAEDKRAWYRRAHPSFTMYRALSYARLTGEVQIRCFGCVEYRDTSTMGLYGYSVGSGVTSFDALVQDAPYFQPQRGYVTPSWETERR